MRRNLPSIHPNARRRPRTSLLVWHDLVVRDKLVWFDTTVAEFEAQLDRLEKAGARPIPLTRVTAWLTTGQEMPPAGAVALCFDDNTLGIYRHAFPALRRRGWPFAVSAHTAFVGVKTGKPHCTWAQLREMEAGGATIVCQTRTHPPDLRTLTGDALQAEMTLSRATMEKTLGHPVRLLTYPSGKWNARVALAAQQAGYTLALTEDFGQAEKSPHRLGIHRYSTHRRFAEALAAVQRSAASRS